MAPPPAPCRSCPPNYNAPRRLRIPGATVSGNTACAGPRGGAPVATFLRVATVPSAWIPLGAGGLMDLDQEVRGFDNVCRLFPLTGVVLFPHAVLPLHIFEPRYRQ